MKKMPNELLGDTMRRFATPVYLVVFVVVSDMHSGRLFATLVETGQSAQSVASTPTCTQLPLLVSTGENHRPFHARRS
jgi:hypothetical protein